MEKFLIIFVLATSFFLNAVLISSADEPRLDPNIGIQQEVKSAEGFLTQKGLQIIAVNFYKYMFEEEHEWKGTKIKDGEELIRSIVSFKADSLTLAYMVSFNPDGHVLILSNKNYGNPFQQHGSGIWELGVDVGEVSIYDERFSIITKRRFDKLKKDIESNKLKVTDKDKEKWEKFSVPNEEFHERHNFDGRTTKPDWWLEKKQANKRESQLK